MSSRLVLKQLHRHGSTKVVSPMAASRPISTAAAMRHLTQTHSKNLVDHGAGCGCSGCGARRNGPNCDCVLCQPFCRPLGASSRSISTTVMSNKNLAYGVAHSKPSSIPGVSQVRAISSATLHHSANCGCGSCQSLLVHGSGCACSSCNVHGKNCVCASCRTSQQRWMSSEAKAEETKGEEEEATAATDAENKATDGDEAEPNEGDGDEEGMEAQEEDDEEEEEEIPVEKTKEELLEDQIKDLKDQLIRSYADQENTRKIAARDVASAKQFAIKSFAKSLLDVSDNLSRALESIPEDSLKGDDVLRTLYEGVEMTDRGLSKAFEVNGLQRYGQVGEGFDPNKHNALFEYVDPDKEVGTIGQLVKPGYLLHKRVLRPAEVGVVKEE